jgi:hypothetical protein
MELRHMFDSSLCRNHESIEVMNVVEVDSDSGLAFTKDKKA